MLTTDKIQLELYCFQSTCWNLWHYPWFFCSHSLECTIPSTVKKIHVYILEVAFGPDLYHPCILRNSTATIRSCEVIKKEMPCQRENHYWSLADANQISWTNGLFLFIVTYFYNIYCDEKVSTWNTQTNRFFTLKIFKDNS